MEPTPTSSMGIFAAREETTPRGRFNADMLVTAREAQFLTQSALAKKIGVGQSLIGKWEAEISEPNDAQVLALSDALHVQPNFFFVHRARRLASMSDFYHRALSKARRTDIKAIHARCNVIDLQIDRLLRIAEPRENKIPDIDPDKHAGDVEKIAAMARVVMGVPSGPIDNLTKIVEDCGGIVVDRNLEIEDIDALCRWVPGLPKLFFVNGSRPADRIRFSLAHELAHTIMHFDRDYDHRTAEDQANAFASAFLMPAADIRRDFTQQIHLKSLAALKRKWRVSMQALVRRAYDMGCIEETRYTSINIQMSRNGWKKTEPVEIARETPSEFYRFLRLHTEAGYTVSDLAQLLLIPETAVSQMLAESATNTSGAWMRMAT